MEEKEGGEIVEKNEVEVGNDEIYTDWGLYREDITGSCSRPGSFLAV